MIRGLKFVGGLLLAGLLAACGGGGGSPGETTGGGSGEQRPAPAALEVFTSAPELTSAANSSLTFTVVVKDSNNQAIPAQTVTFAASSGNLVGALPSPATGANGEAITGVSLQPGTDRSNRNITVDVRAGGVTQQVVIPVTGTSISVSGDSSILLNGTAQYTARAVDSAGQPIQGATLTVSSSLGNSVSPQTVTTNSQGAANFTYSGSRAGNDTITVSGLGTRGTSAVSVSAQDFSFLTPSANSNVPIGTNQTVTVRLLNNGAPVVGQTVTFNSTRGVVTPGTAVTDASGQASATLSSNSSGPATVVAQAASTQVNLQLTFVATTPASLVLQANPGAIAPNTSGTTTNQATLQATVRDAAGNPVSGRVVNFSAVVDPSNGAISPGSATTDSSGNAQVQFISGPLSTANNGVVVSATVQGTGISGSAALTVNAQALFISIASGNQIGNLNQTTYEREFSVYVTDANGAPAANRVVNLSVFPDRYRKGRLMFNDTVWVIAEGAVSCDNEDVDRDGILDAGEDRNGDGRLTPGLPVVIAPAAVTTDAAGFATFKVQYGENYAPWLETTITARASVGGTESVQTSRYVTVGSAEDFSSEDVAPAGAISPFGTGSTCEVPN